MRTYTFSVESSSDKDFIVLSSLCSYHSYSSSFYLLCSPCWYSNCLSPSNFCYLCRLNCSTKCRRGRQACSLYVIINMLPIFHYFTACISLHYIPKSNGLLWFWLHHRLFSSKPSTWTSILPLLPSNVVITTGKEQCSVNSSYTITWIEYLLFKISIQ